MAALKRLWQTKLADSGFVDAEHKDTLKRWHGHDFRRARTIVNIADTMLYYELTQELLNSLSSDVKKLDRAIWALHCEGATLKETAQKLKCTVYRAYIIVKGYKNQMLRKR